MYINLTEKQELVFLLDLNCFNASMHHMLIPKQNLNNAPRATVIATAPNEINIVSDMRFVMLVLLNIATAVEAKKEDKAQV